MTPSLDNGKALDRIAQLSGRLMLSCTLLIVLLPLTVALYWALADTATLLGHAGLAPELIHAPLRLWQRIAGGLLAEAPVALLLLGVWQARKCFQQFALGQIFTTHAIRHLRHFAAWTAAAAAAGIVATSGISVVLTLNNPPHLRHLAIGIGSNEVLMLFFAGMIWLMAGVIGQGQAIAKENAEFV